MTDAPPTEAKLADELLNFPAIDPRTCVIAVGHLDEGYCVIPSGMIRLAAAFLARTASPPAPASDGATFLTEIIDYFAASVESPGDFWAHPDDNSSYCLDHQARDGTKFWIDLEKEGSIAILWKSAKADKPQILRFTVAPPPAPALDARMVETVDLPGEEVVELPTDKLWVTDDGKVYLLKTALIELAATRADRGK